MGISGGEGTVQYKKSTSKYWKKAEGLSFLIDESGTYDIKYSDINNNSLTQTYIITINESDNKVECHLQNNK